MNASEPAISFRELFAYTDYLATRWFAYLAEHEAALEIQVGGETGTLGKLVEHIVRVEQFFADRLLGQAPDEKPGTLGVTDLAQMHADASRKFEAYLTMPGDNNPRRTQMLGTRTVSHRKMLAQAALHCVHHWGQVAMEVRQAGLPVGIPQDIILTNLME
ncbi:MAG: DinB family protein [Acidobacteria bacterium]|nr:DinB family protein [Acidobacteriota bacterium]